MGNGAVQQGSSFSARRYSENELLDELSSPSPIHLIALFFNKSEVSSSGSEKLSNAVTPDVMAICDSSWRRIAMSSETDHHGHLKSGMVMFCSNFLIKFRQLDTNDVCFPLFKPRAQSSNMSTSTLLLRVIKYLLSVPNESFKVKSKIRSLGRAHARRGIEQRQYDIFREALLQTIADKLDGFATHEIISSWAILLGFVISQLTFDKIVFVSHHTRDAEIAANREKHTNSVGDISAESKIVSSYVPDSKQLDIAFKLLPATPTVSADRADQRPATGEEPKAEADAKEKVQDAIIGAESTEPYCSDEPPRIATDPLSVVPTDPADPLPAPVVPVGDIAHEVMLQEALERPLQTESLADHQDSGLHKGGSNMASSVIVFSKSLQRYSRDDMDV